MTRLVELEGVLVDRALAEPFNTRLRLQSRPPRSALRPRPCPHPQPRQRLDTRLTRLSLALRQLLHSRLRPRLRFTRLVCPFRTSKDNTSSMCIDSFRLQRTVQRERGLDTVFQLARA